MIRLTPPIRLFAICLSALAGFVDAVGFIGTGGYFLSFMSGNSTRMAVGLAENYALIVMPLGLIVCFVSGVVLGTAVGRYAGARRVEFVLTMIAALLSLAMIAYVSSVPALTFALAAIAMGAENTIFEQGGEVRIGLTYMTGTLVKLGQRLHGAMTGGAKRGWLPYLLLWMGLAGGAIAGAFAFSVWQMNSLWVAVGAALLLALAGRRLTI